MARVPRKRKRSKQKKKRKGYKTRTLEERHRLGLTSTYRVLANKKGIITIKLTPKESKKFAAALINPPKPNKKLKKLLEGA